MRVGLGLGGVVALIAGILLLVVPGKTIQLAAIVLGIAFVVMGGMRLTLGILGRLHSSQHRILVIVFGLLMLVAGIIMLRDSAATAASLLLIVVLFTGIGWIVDGLMSIVESDRASSRAWAITHGVISLIAGIFIIAVPGWSIVWVVLFAAISSIGLGLIALVRAFTLGRHDSAKSPPESTSTPVAN